MRGLAHPWDRRDHMADDDGDYYHHVVVIFQLLDLVLPRLHETHFVTFFLPLSNKHQTESTAELRNFRLAR